MVSSSAGEGPGAEPMTVWAVAKTLPWGFGLGYGLGW